MAVELSGTGQYLSHASATPKTGVPLTLAIRFNPDTITGFRSLLCLANGSATDFFMLGTDSDQVRIISSASEVEVQVYSSNSFGTGAWHSAVGRFAATNSRRVSLNGTLDAADTNSSSPAAMTRMAVGALSSGGGNLFDGKLAEAAVWGVSLEDRSVTAFHNGYSPLCIEPKSLLWYRKLIVPGEHTHFGSIALSATGSPTAFAHPRTMYKRRNNVTVAVAAPPAGVTLAQIERGLVRGMNRGLRAA